MRKLIPIAFVALILASGYLALRLVPNSNARPARPVKLASGEWEPFIGPTLQNHGPVAEIVTEAMQRMGYQPEITYASWELIQEQASRAEVLGAFPLILSNERLEKYYASDPILEFEYVLFYNVNTIQKAEEIQAVSDLQGHNYRFGKVRGYDVWPELAETIGEFDVEYDTSAAAFQALAAGEIDFLPEGRIAGLFFVNSSSLLVDSALFDILDAAPDSGLTAQEGLHFLMPQTAESRSFLDEFNLALAEVKETPLYPQTLAQIEASLVQQTLVELQPIPGEAYITVIDDLNNSEQFRVPLGTQAVVIQWDESFVGGTAVNNSSSEPAYSYVKLINGPQAGRIVKVDSRTIRLMP